MNYRVIIERIELIELTLEANSPQDAEERALMDGEETASKTTALNVRDVEEVNDER